MSCYYDPRVKKNGIRSFTRHWHQMMMVKREGNGVRNPKVEALQEVIRNKVLKVLLCP